MLFCFYIKDKLVMWKLLVLLESFGWVEKAILGLFILRELARIDGNCMKLNDNGHGHRCGHLCAKLICIFTYLVLVNQCDTQISTINLGIYYGWMAALIWKNRKENTYKILIYCCIVLLYISCNGYIHIM